MHGADAVSRAGGPGPFRVELLATGDELLTGQVVDTNSAWLLDRLWDLGVMARRKTLVGDDRSDLLAALRALGARGSRGPPRPAATNEPPARRA